jgi:NADPH:quinone reductase-like Zn-dependent oxidoreductase
MRVCSVRDEGKIKPIIAGKFPLLEAAKASEVLESGRVNGKIVFTGTVGRTAELMNKA